MAYASRTGTRRNLDALRAAGWGLLVSAAGAHRTEGFEHYCLDNGAWSAHRTGRPWDESAFVRLVERHGRSADFIVAPDIVCGGAKSLALSLAWLPRLLPIAPVLIAVQNGMRPADVARMLGPRAGVFVGGDTDWKLATMHDWAAAAHAHGAWCHVGRVNSARRIRLCGMAGVDSFDGSSASRYAVELPGLDSARRQGCFRW